MVPHDVQVSASDVRRPPRQAAQASASSPSPRRSDAAASSSARMSPAAQVFPSPGRPVVPVSGAGDITSTARGTSPATAALRIAGQSTGRRVDVVIVGVDGSLGSSDAVNWAAGVCIRRHATLRLVHAYPVPSLPLRRGGPADVNVHQRAPTHRACRCCWRSSVPACSRLILAWPSTAAGCPAPRTMSSASRPNGPG